MSKSKSKQEEARQILDDLDSLSPMPTSSAPGTSTRTQDPTEVLAFIDEITQKSSEPTRLATPPQVDRPTSRAGTPTLRKSERVRVGGPASKSPSATSTPDPSTNGNGNDAQQAPQSQNSSGWGWGSVWSTASAAIQQARSVVDEQVKNLPTNEQARMVIEYAKSAQLDKLGQDFKRVGLSTLTDILNVVAPPISKHEVIQVSLSHDMSGHDGLESLVYRALAKVMEQVEGGDLIVNRGNEYTPKAASNPARELNAVEGYDTALKLAQASLDELIKGTANRASEKQSSDTSPTTYSQVYLRIQPFTWASESHANGEAQAQLKFLLHLSDPANQLLHTLTTQPIPALWVDFWDEYDWVEDLVAETLTLGVEVIGQDYLVARMGWCGKDAKVDVVEDEVVVVDEKDKL